MAFTRSRVQSPPAPPNRTSCVLSAVKRFFIFIIERQIKPTGALPFGDMSVESIASFCSIVIGAIRKSLQPMLLFFDALLARANRSFEVYRNRRARIIASSVLNSDSRMFVVFIFLTLPRLPTC